MKKGEQLGEILWESLFGELEKIPNINLPEDTAAFNKELQNKKNRFKEFIEGSGKPFYDEIKTSIRTKVFELITKQEDCNCKTCNTLKEINFMCKMLAKAELLTK